MGIKETFEITGKVIHKSEAASDFARDHCSINHIPIYYIETDDGYTYKVCSRSNEINIRDRIKATIKPYPPSFLLGLKAVSCPRDLSIQTFCNLHREGNLPEIIKYAILEKGESAEQLLLKPCVKASGLSLEELLKSNIPDKFLARISVNWSDGISDYYIQHEFSSVYGPHIDVGFKRDTGINLSDGEQIKRKFKRLLNVAKKVARISHGRFVHPREEYTTRMFHTTRGYLNLEQYFAYDGGSVFVYLKKRPTLKFVNSLINRYKRFLGDIKVDAFYEYVPETITDYGLPKSKLEILRWS